MACYLFKKADFIQRTWIVFPLTKDNEFYWLEHPNRDLDIDIGLLPIMMPPETKPVHINDLPTTEILPEVSHDVFILGYPFPPTSIHGLPIWKRGSIASEPGGSSNFFYVDTASRPGMSGAPVLNRYRGFYKTDRTSQAMNDSDWFGEGTDFIGIYSGRIGAEDALQLGRVWKKRLIEEIIESFTKYVEP